MIGREFEDARATSDSPQMLMPAPYSYLANSDIIDEEMA